MSAPKPPVQTGEQLLTTTVELAQIYKWRVAHFRAAQTSKGYRTPVSADGKGFPDLVMLRPPRLIFAEMKGPRERIAPEQMDWLRMLAELSPRVLTDLAPADVCRVEVYCWRPEDWAEIARVLR